jgi:hypothetical protein
MKNNALNSKQEDNSTKSTMHSKITGNFGESLLLYFLSKSYYEPALVDHSGIDIIAYNKTDRSRIGVSVKARSRTLLRPNDGLLVPGDNYKKIMESCIFYDSIPHICFVFDVPATEKNGTIHLFLMSIETLLHYYPNFKDGKGFTFSMKSNLDKYLGDKNIARLKFEYNSENWN